MVGCVAWYVDLTGPNWHSSTNISGIAMTFSQMIKLTAFGDLLTFHLAQPWGWHLWVKGKCLQLDGLSCKFLLFQTKSCLWKRSMHHFLCMRRYMHCTGKTRLNAPLIQCTCVFTDIHLHVCLCVSVFDCRQHYKANGHLLGPCLQSQVAWA